MPSASREAIYAALFAKLKAIPGLKVASRRLQHFSEVQGSSHPALFQVQKSEHAQVTRGIPTRWNLKVDVFLYAWQSDKTAAASSVLNPLLDAIEQAFKPDNPTVNDCTLGGLVSHCRIEGPVEIYEGVSDGCQSIAILSVDLMTA